MSIVRAAGGVPARSGDSGLEVLVVHRPAYGDWTFPKGKCERGESDEDCARREVEEETGLVCELDGELPLNTFGGSLSTGRIHGLWHIIEGALQASGRAGERQVKDVNVSFVGASAPIVEGTTFIFVKEPY